MPTPTESMLRIEPQQGGDGNTVPHLLPCRINFDGKVPASESHWATERENGKDNERVGYFRGRKLHGKSVKLPEGYKGVVVEGSTGVDADTDGDETKNQNTTDEDPTLIGAVAVAGHFDEVVVWGHEATADTASDPFVRGMNISMKDGGPQDLDIGHDCGRHPYGPRHESDL
ncbi:hypothetical protein MKZ38_005325 [Zalerion maritima]|uniref:Uncharacterized protein n=1 Tax=Zalerion maritima TaxID=339359 RepID=A0AAD5RW28_9PEZI|nr:hypothetical protein MKZ38_005325 [Zalerion maritima]